MKTKNILKNISFAVLVILITFSITKAGDLFPSGTSILPTFYTLGDVYNKLIDNTTSADEGDHDLTLSATPTSTFHTLKEIYEAIPTIDANKMLTTADYMGVTGTIISRGAVTITPSTTAQTITAGYHNGSGTVLGDTDLSSSNILSGINIFGVTGTSSPSQPLKTGQTLCYDPSGSTGDEISCAGTGQDGAYSDVVGQEMSYTTTTNTVLDNSTGLMWKKCSEGLSGDNCETGSATTHTFAQAIAICEDDTTDGYTNWRLPNIRELLSIVDYSKVNPAIDTTIFPETVSGHYWSSTASLFNPNFAWNASVYVGSTGFDNKGTSFYVRCVR
ncbi:MAG: DUF1566 domain-containing protein [Patescibacteria group bacterium]|nr:DUF1566 domain-containing protein [Patescibacteria group bacterium]MDD4304747.1 DUF1566 domain-containing protein [Patescibacteria group bacterium]MDD4695758.1 DUF1566 domain-containing protein [Patescibacteria group bacterium]